MSESGVVEAVTEDLGSVSVVPKSAPVSTTNALSKALTGRVGLLILESMTGIVCARILKPQGRGELSAMILWPVFLCQIFTLGIPSATIFSIRSKPGRIGATISGAMTLSLVTSLITVLFGFLVLPRWLTHYDPNIVRHSQWFMWFAPVSMAVMILRGIWESFGEFGRSALSLIMTRALTLVSLIGLASMHRLSSVTAAYTYLLAGIPTISWMLWVILPLAEWDVKAMVSAGRSMLVYGLRSYGIDLCGALSQYIDQALVLGMLTSADMGTYTVALSLSRILNVFAVAASTVLFPRTVGTSPRNAVLTAIRTEIAVCVMAGFGGTAMILLGGTALHYLYGREYMAATLTLNILIIEAILSGAITVMSQPFMALGRPGVVTVLQITGLLTSIPLILVLVPRFGTEGACIALVLSACVRILLLGVCYARVLPKVVHWRHDVIAEAMSLFRSFANRFAAIRRPSAA